MKDLIKFVSKENDIPEYLVRSVVNHYFKEVKKALNHPEYKKIELGRLGCFNIDRHQLNVKIYKQLEKIMKASIKYDEEVINEEKETFKQYWNLRNYLNKNYDSKPFKQSNLERSRWYRLYKQRKRTDNKY